MPQLPDDALKVSASGTVQLLGVIHVVDQVQAQRVDGTGLSASLSEHFRILDASDSYAELTESERVRISESVQATRVSGTDLTVSMSDSVKVVDQTPLGRLSPLRASVSEGVKVRDAAVQVPITGGGVYLEARSNIARAGVTYAGLSLPYFQILMGGVDHTNDVHYHGFTITHRLNGAASCVFTVTGITPVIGHELRVIYARPTEYLFVGTVLSIECVPLTTVSDHLSWHVTAVGEEWLLDRYDRVTANYIDRGVNAVLADLLARYTDGGFRVGYCPSSLGNVSFDFDHETLTGAINRLAAAKDAFWTVHDRVVDLFDTYPAPVLPTIIDSTRVHRLRYAEDGTQFTTRKIYRGQGSPAESTTSAGASTVSLSDVGPFSESGGTAISGHQVFTYTGKSAGAGLGLLTGVSGLVDDIQSGAEVAIYVDVEDAAAQTALAALLGGSLSGQATDYHADSDLSRSEAEARAASDLVAFKTVLKDLEYGDTHRGIRIGRVVTLNMSLGQPLIASGTFRIQMVTIEPRGKVGGRDTDLWRRVSTSRVTRHLTALLKQIES